jgi:tRNA G37 N-methylase Trm5
VDKALARRSLHESNGIFMKYGFGDLCEGNIRRQVEVTFICGERDRIVDVNENGMCIYEMVVETVAACSHKRAEHLRMESRELGQ